MYHSTAAENIMKSGTAHDVGEVLHRSCCEQSSMKETAHPVAQRMTTRAQSGERGAKMRCEESLESAPMKADAKRKMHADKHRIVVAGHSMSSYSSRARRCTAGALFASSCPSLPGLRDGEGNTSLCSGGPGYGA